MIRRYILGLILALALVGALVSPAIAATSQDVTVTATPIYIALTNSPSSEPLGTVAASSTIWASGSTPADPLVDAGCTFTITNTGSVAELIQIKGSNFTGGVGWTLAATVGENTVVIKAGKSGDAHAAMIALTTTNQTFITSLASSATKKWEFNLQTGTFTDGVEKSGTITLTASAA